MLFLNEIIKLFFGCILTAIYLHRFLLFWKFVWAWAWGRAGCENWSWVVKETKSKRHTEVFLFSLHGSRCLEVFLIYRIFIKIQEFLGFFFDFCFVQKFRECCLIFGNHFYKKVSKKFQFSKVCPVFQRFPKFLEKKNEFSIYF